MKRKHKIIITIIITSLIILILAVLFLCFLARMYKSAQLHYSPNSQCIHQFYEERPNSLDGIYIGSSAADRYWIPSIAYEDYGFCIYNFGTTCQPFVSLKYLINEVLKTQPDIELIIIEPRNIIRPADWTEDKYFYCISDYIPFSRNKIEMIDAYLDHNQSTGANINFDKEDYLFPLLRHDPNLQESSQELSDEGSYIELTDGTTREAINCDAAITFLLDKLFSQSLSQTIDEMKILHSDEEMIISKGYRVDEYSFETDSQPDCKNNSESKPLNPIDDALLDDFLEYCNSISAKILFVSSPYSYQSEDRGKEARYVMEKCEKAGFEILDFNCEPLLSEVGMDYKRDYYDLKHVNFWGARRYTKFLANYLDSTYNLKDHRGDPQYKSWDDSLQKLNELIIQFRPQ